MRHSLLLALLAAPAVAAPLPFPSRSADRATFEAPSAGQAATAVTRVASPAFLERVLKAAPGVAAKAPAGADERRKWAAERLEARPAGERRVRVRVVGLEGEPARELRDAVAKVLTEPLTAEDRRLLMTLQGEMIVGYQRNRLVVLRGVAVGGGGVARMVVNEDVDLRKILQAVRDEMMATPLRKVP